MERYVGWGCILSCFMLSSLPWFYAFFLICYPYILFHFLLLFMSLFQQQMHAWAEVCHLLQSSKSPLTGFLCSIGWRIIDQTMQAFFKHSLHTNSISNSVTLRNNYISFHCWVICAHAYTWRKNGVVKEAIVLQWAVWIASCDFKLGKERWAGALLSEKCCCFVRKPSWKIHANLN